MSDSANRRALVIASVISIILTLCLGIVFSFNMALATEGASQPVYANPSVAPMSIDGERDRLVFLSMEGPGHVEARLNCSIAGDGLIHIEDESKKATFLVVPDSILDGASVSCSEGLALRSGNEVSIQPGLTSCCYSVRFRKLSDRELYDAFPPVLMLACFDDQGLVKITPEPAPEPTPEGEPMHKEEQADQPEAAPEQEVVVEQPAEEQYEEQYEEPAPAGPRFVWEGYDSHGVGPDDVLTRWCADLGYKWYLAHSYTWYGQMIASLNIGDQVMVDGNLVTIEGITRAYPGDNSAEIYDMVGGMQKTIFQTCIEDGSEQVWIIYGE